MTALYIILGIVSGLVVIVAVLSFLAPAESTVSRSITVNMSQQDAYDILKSLKKFQEWGPWAGKDPNQKITYKGTDGEVGSSFHWAGNKEVGEGEQEVIQLEAPNLVKTELRFIKPFKAISSAHFAVNPADDGKTEITWGYHAHNKFPAKIFLLFMDMDKVLGGEFQKGLDKFKATYDKA